MKAFNGDNRTWKWQKVTLSLSKGDPLLILWSFVFFEAMMSLRSIPIFETTFQPSFFRLTVPAEIIYEDKWGSFRHFFYRFLPASRLSFTMGLR
jgi:hypothetical protein